MAWKEALEKLSEGKMKKLGPLVFRRGMLRSHRGQYKLRTVFSRGLLCTSPSSLRLSLGRERMVLWSDIATALSNPLAG